MWLLIRTLVVVQSTRTHAVQLVCGFALNALPLGQNAVRNHRNTKSAVLSGDQYEPDAGMEGGDCTERKGERLCEYWRRSSSSYVLDNVVQLLIWMSPNRSTLGRALTCRVDTLADR
jgi:hypothetical protein